MTRAVVLLSGGLDSATSLAIAAEAGYELYTLSFDYGQRSQKELECARMLAEHYAAQEHKIIKLPLDMFGGSALTDPSIPVPKASNENDLPHGSSGIPVSYVPARNTILLSLALAYAEVSAAEAVFIGVNAVDYSGYPDCRPEYITAFQALANLATKRAVEGNPTEIKAPLLYLSKADIVSKGLELSVPYEKTWSCYEGFEKACGKCYSCRIRLDAFRAAGAEDPIPYA